MIEEITSKKYLELLGLSPDDRDKVFSELKKFNGLRWNSSGVSENFVYLAHEIGNDEYSRCGLQRPYKIFQKNSCTINTLDTGDVLEGHFVVWIQEYSENGRKYMENWMT